MGQSPSKGRRASDSSTTPLKESEHSLLEKTYENFYGSDTYANLSSTVAVNALPTATDVPTTPGHVKVQATRVLLDQHLHAISFEYQS